MQSNGCRATLYNSSNEVFIPDNNEYFDICQNKCLGLYEWREIDPVPEDEAYLLNVQDDSIIRKISMAMCIDEDNNERFIESNVKYLPKENGDLSQCKSSSNKNFCHKHF